jgi:ABC-type lipoprotein release transport system permease subunit
MRVTSRVRQQLGPTIAVAGAIAVAAALVLAVSAGARRTGSAPDRYTASVGGDVDASITQRQGPPLTDEVAALPSVQQVSGYTFVFGGVDPSPDSIVAFAGDRPLSTRIIAGRDLDQSNPHEFLADRSFAKATGAHVGDQFGFQSISRKTIESGQGFGGEPDGAAFRATLVGILASPDEINSDLTVAVFPAALLEQDVGYVATVMQVRLKPGYSTPDLRRELDTLPNHATLSLDSGSVVSDDIRHAVDAQAVGLWLLAAVLGVAALVALGQLLTRHVQRADHEHTPLVAVGFTRRQRVTESLLLAAIPAIAGVVVGAIASVAFSGNFPTGFARALEPSTGPSVDFVALLFGSVTLLGAVLVWVVVAATYEEHLRTRPAATHRGRLLTRLPATAGAIGARFAMMRGARRRPAYGTIIGLSAVVGLVVGAGTFAASVDRLVTDRARFGQNYTLALGDDGSDHSPAELRAFADQPDVAGLMILSEGSARVAGTTANLGLVGVETVKGDLAPRVLTGRLPERADEIALGRVSASDLGRGVGDQIRLQPNEGTTTVALDVVGVVVVPGVGGNDGVGSDSVVTRAAFNRINGPSDTNVAAVRVRAGAAPDAARRLAVGSGAPPTQQEDLPSAIANVQRVRRVPTALAALLGMLMLLTLLHALYLSIRSRRVDVAILKGLGANRRWISRVVHSQATLLAVVPIVIGIPLGLLAGTRVFRSFVDRIGAVPDPTVPTAAIVAIALGLVVLANLAAVLPARRARRFATAVLLRVE